MTCSRRGTRLLAFSFILLAWLAASPATPAAQPELGEPYLVRDIETTGEPVFDECMLSACPPPVPIYGALLAQITPLGDRIVFVADDRDHGGELWVSDGTAAGTLLLADVCSGECGSEPVLLAELAGHLYFWARSTGESGHQLWETDGTPGGTRALSELCPDLCAQQVIGQPLAVFEGSLFLQVYDDDAAHFVLWRTDGTPAGTAPVVPLCARSPCFAQSRIAFEYQGHLFFEADGDLLRLAAPAASPVVAWSGEPREIARVGDRLVLALSNSLWSLTGPNQTVEPLFTPDYRSHVSGLRSFGGWLYFVVEREGNHTVWRTDGTPGGSEIVSFTGLDVNAPLVPVGERLLFTSGGAADEGQSLHALDLSGPSARVVPLPAFPASGLFRVGERVVFRGFDDAHGTELWTSDGTAAGTGRAADIFPGAGSSNPGVGGRALAGPVVAGDRLYFAADHPDFDIELWALPLVEPPPPAPEDPPPPGTDWLQSSNLPGFRVQVRITAGGSSLAGRAEAACLAETLCVSGAVPGRSEVFVRVVGPKGNGRLWPTLVRFSTSTIEVWIEQLASGEIEYYRLPGATPGSGELPGLFDREGFEPR